MSFLAYLQIFEAYWFSTLLYFFPAIITYKQFALLTAFAFVVILFIELVKKKFIIKKAALIIGLILLFALCMYYATPFHYKGVENTIYNSFFLVIVGQLIPGIILASFMVCDFKAQEKVKKLAPVVAIIFTFITLMGVIHPTSVTSGGFVDNANGMNYQNSSYLAAYASILFEFYLLNKHEEYQLSFFKSKFGTMIIYLFICLDAVVVLLSGGRGGFLIFVIFLLVFTFLTIKKLHFSKNKVFGLICGIIICSIAGFFVVKLVANSTLETSGFSRIVNLLSGGGDPGREKLRKKAIESFCASPIWGHGLGSVFFEMEIYSHNLFTDILVETGIVGLILVIIFLLIIFVKCIKMIRESYSNLIWILLGFCDFMGSMFSGYWLGHIMLWWALTFILLYKTNRIETRTIYDGKE